MKTMFILIFCMFYPGLAITDIVNNPGAIWQTAPEKPNRFGLGVNLGEPFGTMGLALSWNFSKRLQLQFSQGKWYSLDGGTKKVWTSNQILIRHYWRQVYVDMGVLQRWGSLFPRLKDTGSSVTGRNWGLPLHAGFEYGNRTSFFLGASLGVEWMPWGEGILSSRGQTMTIPGNRVTIGVHFGSYMF